MSTKLNELLNDQGENYIFPFFWQHGESEDVLREYMEAIYNSNIRAVCVEARPHPDYAGPAWWKTLDVILEEARQRSMKVWILDDAHFPTGFANGALLDADPRLCKLYLDVKIMDIAGPIPSVTMDIHDVVKYERPVFLEAAQESIFTQKDKRLFDDDGLVGVLAAPLVHGNTIGDEIIDITENIVEGQLIWDVPEGIWRVFVVVRTRNGGGRTDYINVLDYDSCRLLVDSVYEPHYERYHSDFGHVIAGFFSDEPQFGNTEGFDFDEILGKKKMPLPWSDELEDLLKKALKETYRLTLPLLWNDCTNSIQHAKARYTYMDICTKLVAKNFSGQIGQWCSEHGVEYIGHVIEDNNQHTRLGSGLGHYFRATSGQHMAGIDNIGSQVKIGADEVSRSRIVGKDGDGEFYHYALGKLASSFAHIDPRKQGRAMCEIYGAYGWEEGIHLMKYLVDHFLVRGINHYVPHAFSPKPFPDEDCPPHFYAHGHNPQYGRFGILMKYINRVCHLLNDGTHIAPVALLYHAEGEWTGADEAMYLQEPAKELFRNQIDFDILPSDVFQDKDYFGTKCGKKLTVNDESYSALVIPYTQYITRDVYEFLKDASEMNFPVLFMESFPKGVCNLEYTNDVDFDFVNSSIRTIGLPDLAQELLPYANIQLDPIAPFVRYYQYQLSDATVYLFNNESSSEDFQGQVTLKTKGRITCYDALSNRVFNIASEAKGDAQVFPLHLSARDSMIILASDYEAMTENPDCTNLSGKSLFLDNWTVSSCLSHEYPKFNHSFSTSVLDGYSKKHPNFSGFIRYEAEIDLDDLSGGSNIFLEIDYAHEAPELWINDKWVGLSFSSSHHCFEVSKYLVNGVNRIRIEVATTLFRQLLSQGHIKSFFDQQNLLVEPSGIVGHVKLTT